MNTHSTAGNANSHPMDDDHVRERCLLYLLGEMNRQQAAAFESELSESDELRAELSLQSELVCRLSNIQSDAVAIEMTSSNRSWRVTTTLVAIAATVLVAIACWPTEQARERRLAVEVTPEASLIAHAWAEVALHAGQASDPAANNSEVDEESEVLGSLAGKDQEWGEVSSFDWISSAVEAGAISDG